MARGTSQPRAHLMSESDRIRQVLESKRILDSARLDHHVVQLGDVASRDGMMSLAAGVDR